jgi:hypothetical protein
MLIILASADPSAADPVRPVANGAYPPFRYAVATGAGHQLYGHCFQRIRLHPGGHHRSRVGGKSLPRRHHTWTPRRCAVRLPHGAAAAGDLGHVPRFAPAAIERHFAVHVKRERRMRDVDRLTNTNPLGQMLWRYPDPEPGTGFSSVAFSVFMGRSKDAPRMREQTSRRFVSINAVAASDATRGAFGNTWRLITSNR